MSTCVDSYSSFSTSSIGSGGSFSSKKKQYSAIVHIDSTPDEVIPVSRFFPLFYFYLIIFSGVLLPLFSSGFRTAAFRFSRLRFS